MNYVSKTIKEGIKLHLINTEKYKTNLITVFLSVPLSRESVTYNALIASILRLGTDKLKTQEEISKKLEEMYGAEFNCGIEKIGDNQLLKFYIEVLNDEFLPQKEELLKQAINLLFDLTFNPVIENEGFLQKYVDTEKVNLKNIIESKINNKEQYAFDRCIEEMYKDEPYAIYKYGYVDDLQTVDEKSLYKRYIKLLNTAKIDIYVSGKYNDKEIEDIIKMNDNLKKLQDRNVDGFVNKEIQKKVSEKENAVEEKMNVTQGKLVLGLDINENYKDLKYTMGIYNVILGASATSKLFQNVREKASLAYTARSSYIRQKNNVFINCGIEIENYEKAIPIIYEQLDAMKNGDFTEEDLKIAKRTMISAVKAIQDEQDSELTYFIAQELTNDKPDYEEYINKINEVTREQVQDVANKITINTIYFLRN